MKAFFQKLVLGVMALYLVYILIPFAWHYIYNEETLTALTWNGYGGLVSLYGPAPYFVSAFFFVSLLGLYNFKKWGRLCFTVYTIVSGLLVPIWGLSLWVGLMGQFLISLHLHQAFCCL